MDDLFRKATEHLIDGLNHKKEYVIKQRIIELGIDPEIYNDLMGRKKFRFNPFVLEDHYERGYQLLYYNDGSENGLFVVGFQSLNLNDDSMTSNFFKHEKPLTMSLSLNYFFEEPTWNKLPRN